MTARAALALVLTLTLALTAAAAAASTTKKVTCSPTAVTPAASELSVSGGMTCATGVKLANLAGAAAKRRGYNVVFQLKGYGCLIDRKKKVLIGGICSKGKKTSGRQALWVYVGSAAGLSHRAG
jgi:hypothetical protein